MTADSVARDLRSACRELGLGRSGSKAQLWKRLQTHFAHLERDLVESTAKTLFEEQNRFANVQSKPREPTADERAQHEVHHTPFMSWCEACVSSRSRIDPHQQQVDESSKRPHWGILGRWI